MDKYEILDQVDAKYLDSRDFNGTPNRELGEDFNEIKGMLLALLKEEEIVLNFGDRHPNPYILAYEPEPKEEQIAKLEAINPATSFFCVYPSIKHLEKIVNRSEYKGRPYSLLLALGHPQLSYRAFTLTVLEYYRNDPRYYYETDDVSGHIYYKEKGGLANEDKAFLQTFGFAYNKEIKHRYVAVFLRYLSDLTPKHQQRWNLEEVEEETFLHPIYAQQSAGHWPNEISIFIAFCEEIRIINEITERINGSKLFKRDYSENRPNKFAFLIRPTKAEYDSFVQLLDKAMSDNLNKDFFKGDLDLIATTKAHGEEVKSQKGTITLLQEWIDKHVRTKDSEPIVEMIKILREIRAERSKPSHRVREDDWDLRYFEEQKKIMIRAYGAIRTLRLLLVNHPAAKEVSVPEWLFKGNICPF